MAGLGAKLFTAFSKLTAAQVNGYLMDQSIMRFATTAARDAAFGGAGEPTLAEGMTCYLDDTNQIQSYNGSAWVGVAASSTVSNVSSGLVYVSTTTFSGGSTAQFNLCFTDAYTNYRALISYTGGSANAVYLRWLVNTTVQTGNNFSMQFGSQYLANSYTGATRGDQYIPLVAAYPTYPTTYAMDIFSPQATGYTSLMVNTSVLGVSASDSGMTIVNARNVATTQFDGFELTTAGATNIAGTMTLYGYRKA
jgi:hypothetical protein